MSGIVSNTTNNDEVKMESETSLSEESDVVMSAHKEMTKDDKGGESLDEGEENVDSEGMASSDEGRESRKDDEDTSEQERIENMGSETTTDPHSAMKTKGRGGSSYRTTSLMQLQRDFPWLYYNALEDG